MWRRAASGTTGWYPGKANWHDVAGASGSDNAAVPHTPLWAQPSQLCQQERRRSANRSWLNTLDPCHPVVIIIVFVRASVARLVPVNHEWAQLPNQCEQWKTHEHCHPHSVRACDALAPKTVHTSQNASHWSNVAPIGAGDKRRITPHYHPAGQAPPRLLRPPVPVPAPSSAVPAP
jgi:hypothetical protein